jgi:outer membrane immunogenic protein
MQKILSLLLTALFLCLAVPSFAQDVNVPIVHKHKKVKHHVVAKKSITKKVTKITPEAKTIIAAKSEKILNWTGPYVGLNAGYAFHGSSGGNGTTYTNSFTGETVGGQVGFNYQFSSTVIGVAFDGSYSNATDSPTVSGVPITGLAQYESSLRAKAGYLVYPDTLVYLTAGYSVFGGKYTNNNTSDSSTKTHNGYVVGAGLERYLTENISLYSEYTYSQYSTEQYNIGKGDYSQSEVRLGLNFHF